MGLTKLRTYHFRNLSDDPIHFGSSDVFFIGENGQGKSNLLESIYFLCTGSSFRTHDHRIVIREGSSDMAVEGSFKVDGWETRHSKFTLSKGKRAIELDGATVKRLKSIIHWELVLIGGILICASLMAKGFGA